MTKFKSDFTDMLIGRAGLRSLELAGRRVLRGAEADDKARQINAENAIISRTRVARGWKAILQNASEELTLDVLDEYNSLVHTIDSRQVLVGAAILDALGPMPPKALAPKHHADWVAKARVSLRLGLFWGRLVFSQVPSKNVADKYWQICAAVVVDSGEAPTVDDDVQTVNLSYTTIREDLLTLNRILRTYAKRWHLPFVPQVEIPKEVIRRDVFLTRSDVAALQWAVRGRVWNHETGNWVKVMTVDGRLVNYIDHSTLEHDKGVGREILVETYTGLRPGAAIGLRYKPEREDGWIDVDTATIHRTGHAQPPTKKTKFPTSRIPRRLLQHVRRWRKNDRRRGFTHVIHKRDGTPYSTTQYAFNKIVENAGLDPNVVRHTFRHTLASWLAYIGAEQASAAKLLGMSVGTLDRVYRHLAPATEDNALDKLDDPAARARLRTLTRPTPPSPTARKRPKGLRHNPVAAPPRARRLLGRIRAARQHDAGAAR